MPYKLLTKTLICVSLAAFLANTSIAQNNTAATLKIFGEGVISTGDYETHPAFSPSGDTLYFLKCMPDAGFYVICVSYKKNGKWSEPGIVPFSGKYTDADPFVTADGNSIYFVSNRPVQEDGPVKPDWDIWRVDRAGNTWGKPVHLDSTINTASSEYFPTLTAKGDLYFGSGGHNTKGRSDIFVSRLVNGAYTTPINLGDSINTPDNEYEPYIAPDESYIIFMATRPNGLANADFYISFNTNGTWSKAQNLPEPINSAVTEWGGKVTANGEYFLFGSNRNKITDTLPTRESIQQFTQRIHSAGNGLGDIYIIEMKEVMKMMGR